MSSEQKVTRKLRAIFSADVKGYSVLMANDEVATIHTLKEYRKIMSACIEQRDGRVVDAVGDNLLAEFESAVDAVQCAVEIQKELKEKNERLTAETRLEFRIGINIGDVVQDGDRIYGSGVNVAARIEGLSDPGGICISRNTYDHVKNKLDLGFEYIGEHKVKNIKEPVRVYRVLMDSNSPKPLVEEPLELPNKPSIAVLPFDNMSKDPNQEYFSDGLTEQIINGLCKVPDLFVIARNSSFAYKGKAVSIKQIALELGVKYILEGSVQKAGDRVRITAQLIDATTDYHMWSENYDRELQDIFALQDEIAMKVMHAMEVNLTHGEQVRLWEGVTTRNLKAFDKHVRASAYVNRFTPEDNAQAIKFSEEAIRLDSNYAMAYVILGIAHWTDLIFRWSKSPLESIENVEKCASKALELANSLDWSHLLQANVHLIKHQYDDAIKEGEKALSLNPNGADAHATLGYFYNFYSQPQKGIEMLKKALRLNPLPRPWYYSCLGSAYRTNGDYIEAIEVSKKCVRLTPDFIHPYIILAASYAALGDTLNANEAVENTLRIDPQFSLDVAANMILMKNEKDLNKMIEQLRVAGIPEHSPE